MTPNRDPFEDFREAREREGHGKRRHTDRGVYAARIARLLENLDTAAAPAGKRTEPSVRGELPSRGDLHSVIAHLFTMHSRGDVAEQDRVATLLANFLDLGERVLAGDRGEDFARGLEIEMDYGGLFEFMLNPDVDGLRRNAAG
ncbi:MAG: hypothetical protein CMJ83_11395 [Planctomycetes bacterium]|nr:hypothetical protein [Planctomycetota bacterium]